MSQNSRKAWIFFRARVKRCRRKKGKDSSGWLKVEFSLLSNILKITFLRASSHGWSIDRENCRVSGVRKWRSDRLRNKCNHDVSLFGGDFGDIIGLFLFENAVGQAITVNGARYRDTIIQFFLPKLQDIDDITSHSPRNNSITGLESFPARVIFQIARFDARWTFSFYWNPTFMPINHALKGKNWALYQRDSPIFMQTVLWKISTKERVARAVQAIYILLHT